MLDTITPLSDDMKRALLVFSELLSVVVFLYLLAKSYALSRRACRYCLPERVPDAIIDCIAATVMIGVAVKAGSLFDESGMYRLFFDARAEPRTYIYYLNPVMGAFAIVVIWIGGIVKVVRKPDKTRNSRLEIEFGDGD